MMKPDTENETASYVHEAGGRCREAGSLTGADQVNQHNWLSKFTTFAVGVGIGALVGLLFAPATGKKTRNYISRAVKDGFDDAASTSKRWSRRAQETVDDVKANVAGVVEAGQKAYRTARDAGASCQKIVPHTSAPQANFTSIEKE
jgi:gas vesicle protein